MIYGRSEHRPRGQRIEKLEAAVAALLRRVDVLEAENEGLRTEVATLREENTNLRARRNQNSNNSGKPPSSDGPEVTREPMNAPTGKKPGGQSGHKKSERALLPVEQVDHVVAVVPTRCGQCQCQCQCKRQRQTKDEPRRHQQVELPRPKAEVMEYQCQSVDYLDCGAVTSGELPPEAVPVFGERSARWPAP